ncbi:MAG: hypothetical protein JO112_16380 [Planctomycetes bacterium]|nr:hypothetical protein [Planctomycetota bacterium]
MRPQRAFLLLAGVTWLTLAGCASKGYVTGQVVDNGQPFSIPKGETLGVIFNSTDAAGKTSALVTYVQPDGTFAAESGDNSNGLPPGNYKVRLNGDGPTIRSKMQKSPSLDLKVDKGAKIKLIVDLSKGTITTQ